MFHVTNLASIVILKLLTSIVISTEFWYYKKYGRLIICCKCLHGNLASFYAGALIYFTKVLIGILPICHFCFSGYVGIM